MDIVETLKFADTPLTHSAANEIKRLQKQIAALRKAYNELEEFIYDSEARSKRKREKIETALAKATGGE